MSQKAINMVWEQPVNIEIKMVLLALAFDAKGDDGLEIYPIFDFDRLTRRTRLERDQVEATLINFARIGVIYPRHNGWALDLLKSDRACTNSSGQKAREREHRVNDG